MGINENIDCGEFHNASLIVFDYQTDQTWLKCKDCGREFNDPNLVNEAIIIVIQSRFAELLEPELPSRNRPHDN